MLQRFHMEVTPSPAGRSDMLDADDNVVTQLWFDGLHDHLEVIISSRVETFCINPYNGLLDNGADRLPYPVTGKKNLSLHPYMYWASALAPKDFEAVDLLAKCVLIKSDYYTLNFLSALTMELFDSIEKTVRHEPGIQDPSHTLDSKQGACRDLAVIFMAACNCVGIPARFVSGYQEGDPDEPYGDLHAWTEVYLPGMGWRGFDPTHGLAVADRHIAVASSALPQNTSPLVGSFRGTGACSTLKHTITIEVD